VYCISQYGTNWIPFATKIVLKSAVCRAQLYRKQRENKPKSKQEWGKGKKKEKRE
jgi:hypothetical protein